MSEILFAIPIHFIRKLRQLLFQAKTNISTTTEPIRQRPLDLIITKTTLTKISREMIDKSTQTEQVNRKKVKLSEMIEEIIPKTNHFLTTLEEQEKINKMSQGRAYVKNERRTMQQQQKEILFLAESTGPSSNSE